MHVRRLALLLLLVFTSFELHTAHADGPAFHTVAWGETLYSVARTYRITPQALAAANGLSARTWLSAGQQLRIPGGSSAYTAPQKTPSGMYTVRAGDTLFSIAQQFGVSVDTMAAVNNIPSNGFIYVGSQLKIPSRGTSTNSSAQPAAPPAVAPKSNGTRTSTYVVQPGDNLFRIALRYGTTTQAIALVNNLPSLLVHSGQELTIPTSSSLAPSTSRPPGPSNASSASSAGLSVRVSGVPLYRQRQTLTCEEAAAAMALRGALSESQIVRAMPRSDNPFEGIRGNTNHPTIGGLTHYGTYAQGLQKGLAALGRSSTVLYGQSYDSFKQSVLNYLRAGKPVIWWTTWNQKYETPRLVQTSSGAAVKLTPYEHTVVIVAANDSGVTYHDPYDASVGFSSWADFRRTSGYFGNMALVVQ